MGKILNPHQGFWQNAERKFVDQELESELISDDIQIVYDERYVPHIYAQNMEDALFAQGYLEAQNRLFQMDLMARSVSGNLSEVIGKNPAVLKKDIESIRKGHRTTAAFLQESFQKGENTSVLDKYTQGANHFIKSLDKKDYPFEYKLMDFSPTLWSTEKSIYVLISMADLLCGRADDFEHNNLKEILDEEVFTYFYADNFDIKEPIVPRGTPFNFDKKSDHFDPSMNSYGKIYKTDFSPNRIFGAGSNNWAISGEKSKTGKPILANDPHLGLSLPSIWYELEIHTPEFHAHGVSVPGLAGMMIGFNDDVAWGMTNVSHDIKDFFRITYTDESKTKYFYGDGVKEITKKQETIKRRGEEDYVEQVAYTEWGPIMYSKDSIDLAMHWLRSNYAKKDEPSVYVNCMKSTSYDDFIHNTSGYVAPAQNFICADKSNIGIRVNGTFAAKEIGDGKFIKDGSIPAAGWSDYISEDQLPHSKNPERGFVSSANQRSTTGEYPYYFNGTFATYRGERINALLSVEDKLDVSSLKNMQLDNFNIRARDFLPMFLEVIKHYEDEEYKSILKDWDYTYTEDTEAGTIFYVWYSNYRKMIFDEFSPYHQEMYLKYPFDWKIFELSTQYPDHIIFDNASTNKLENRDDIIKESFVKTYEDLKTESDLAWSAYRPLYIDHVAKISGLGSGAIQLGGSGESINAMRSRFGPSWRMVVALGEEIDAYGVYPGGQSGNPSSKYYKDMLESWVEGDYYKLKLEKDPNKISASRNLKIKSGR